MFSASYYWNFIKHSKTTILFRYSYFMCRFGFRHNRLQQRREELKKAPIFKKREELKKRVKEEAKEDTHF
jgi:hypothetical protein